MDKSLAFLILFTSLNVAILTVVMIQLSVVQLITISFEPGQRNRNPIKTAFSQFRRNIKEHSC